MSVPVTFVANVDADSVDVLIVVSAVDAIDDPITITFCELFEKKKVHHECEKIFRLQIITDNRY